MATDVDVVVVGGGFSGIQAAVDVQAAGYRVVLLEARGRLGGRSLSVPLGGGDGVAELGATWINARTQPKVYQAAKRLGLTTVPQYAEGDDVWELPDPESEGATVLVRTSGAGTIDNSTNSDGNGNNNSVNHSTNSNTNDQLARRLAELPFEMGEAMDECGGAVDLRRPWRFPADQDVDMRGWLERTLGRDDELQLGLFELFAGALVGRSCREMGIHYFVDYVKSGGGWVGLLSEGEDGAQSLRVKEGTSAIATGLAASLSSSSLSRGLSGALSESGVIRLDSPVKSIAQEGAGSGGGDDDNDDNNNNNNGGNNEEDGDDDDEVGRGTAPGKLCRVTTTTGQVYTARKVILAIPTNTYRHIDFRPPLPAAQQKLVTSTLPGFYAKTVLIYPTPWWRRHGLSGKFHSLVGPICFTFDVSASDGPGPTAYGALACFTVGDRAVSWGRLERDARERAVVDHLVQLVGGELAPQARGVREVHHAFWPEEAWLEGAPTSVMPPGLLSGWGASLREPCGDIYFAGAETAFEWKGYLEGALRAGSRAAEEVVAGLRSQG